ncbi:MAG: ComEC/Rec2 family competence protein, partial [Luteibaculum sp.]
YLKLGLSGAELGVAAALIFGDKSLLEDEVKSAFAAAGAMHVLAVSGLHVGIVYLILLILLRKKNHQSLKLQHCLIIIAALWFYALVTGFSPSVQRAATMFSFVALGKGIQRNSNVFNLLAASVIVLIIADPLIITQVGFQMSYLAVLGILLLYPWLQSLWVPKTKIIKALWQISCVSLAAQIATGALGFLYFRQFPTYFLVSNLFVIPLATLVVWLGAIINLLMLLSLNLAIWPAKLLELIITVLNKGVAWVEAWPGALFRESSWNFQDAILYYTALVFFLLWIYSQGKRYLVGSQIALLMLLWPGVENSKPSWALFSHSKADVLLLNEGSQASVISDLSDLSAVDFTLGRYAADQGLFNLKLQPWTALSQVQLAGDSLGFLWRDDELILFPQSARQLEILCGNIRPHVLFIKKPLWDVGCLNELNPQHLVVSNSLGLGYLNWLKKNGLSNHILCTYTKKDGPFIQL